MKNIDNNSFNTHAISFDNSEKAYLASGWIWDEITNSFFDGWIEFENGHIVATGKTRPVPENPKFRGIIIPGLINYHTHLGDGIFAERIRSFIAKKTISEIVAPPNGLKHKLLSEASTSDITQGITKELNAMISNGTTGYIDFREGGNDGLLQMHRALENKILETNALSPINPTYREMLLSVVLGRPTAMKYDEKEILNLLKISDGIGLSSYLDWERNEFRSIARKVNNKHKIFATHVSEVKNESLDEILATSPSLLIHMIHSTKKDWKLISELGIPVVCCPRANSLFGMQPPIPDMYKTGVNVLLGTDNAMFVKPNILEEIRYVYHNIPYFSKKGKCGFRQILKMTLPYAVIPGFSPINLEDKPSMKFIILVPDKAYRSETAEELLATAKIYENVRVYQKYITSIRT